MSSCLIWSRHHNISDYSFSYLFSHHSVSTHLISSHLYNLHNFLFCHLHWFCLYHFFLITRFPQPANFLLTLTASYCFNSSQHYLRLLVSCSLMLSQLTSSLHFLHLISHTAVNLLCVWLIVTTHVFSSLLQYFFTLSNLIFSHYCITF